MAADRSEAQFDFFSDVQFESTRQSAAVGPTLVVQSELTPVVQIKLDSVDLGTLKELSVVSHERFKSFLDDTKVKNPNDIDGGAFFILSGAESDARAALARAVEELPNDSFSLHGKTIDGRIVTINASAQRREHWQVTRFDAKGEPWGDTQYENKLKAISEFLQDIDIQTLDSITGAFGVVQPSDKQANTTALDSHQDKVAMPSVASAVIASRVIQDAGEELVHNRRNRIKTAKGWGDISHLNDALKVNQTVKANVWPKPDYKKLIEDGMDPLVAHMVKQVYDCVAVKPAISSRNVLDDVLLQRYIGALNRVEKGLMQWSQDREALKQWAESNARYAGAMLGRQIALSDVAKEPKTLVDAVFPGGWRTYKEELIISGGNKLLGALQPGYEEIKRATNAIKKGWPEKREAWEIQGFSVVSGATANVEQLGKESLYFVYVNDKFVRKCESMEEAQAVAKEIKPFALLGKRGFIDSFESEELAIDAAKARTMRDKKNIIGDKGMRVEAVEREGVIRRMEGEDVSSERLVTEFGLKGVNFGNWMKTPAARAEAQLHLNHAFDSLHDLADILGVPPKALSLNGMLGLAIGAQGGGGHAAAHFVPGVNEINLTRTSGAGSLAHEWAHAVDHYFATQGELATSAEPFLTEHAEKSLTKAVYQVVDGKQVATKVPRFGSLRPEIVGAFGTIIQLMNKRPETQEEFNAAKATQLTRGKKQVADWLKSIRRDFTGQEEAFDVLSEKIQAGDVGDGKIALSRSVYISPVVGQLRDLYKEKHSRVYSIENIKGLQAWVDSVKFQETKLAEDTAKTPLAPDTVSSDFAKNARALDREKGGKPYWSTDLEKFARSFDAFVSDELETRQAKNDYLSHTNREGRTVPLGDERVAINSAFRALLGEFNVRETERGTALFSIAQRAAVPPVMARSAIAAEIARLQLQWPSMPKVTVVGPASELPFESPGHADGGYYDGQVYVVADNIFDVKQLQKVMAHECILHHSLEEMLGDYGFSKLHHGMQALKAQGDPVVNALAKEIRQRYGVLPADMETKEMVARAGELCLDDAGNVRIQYGFMKQVISGVASWLRNHGFTIPFSNIELQGIMHAAGQWVKREQEGPEPVLRSDRLGMGGLNSFAGVRAENAPLDALKLAREMRLTGVDDRVIWKNTGWTFGFADAKPRFEIADDGAHAIITGRSMFDIWKDMSAQDKTINNIGHFLIKYPENPLSLETKNHAGVKASYTQMATDDPALAKEISQYLAHDDLYSAYPDLAKVKAAQATGIEGMVNCGNASLIPEANLIKFSRISHPEKFRSTTIHELQHCIQECEGFARGGSPTEFKDLDVTEKELSRINGEVHQLYEQNPEFYRAVVKANQLQLSVQSKFGSTNGDVSDPLMQEWWAAIDQREMHPESQAWFSLKSMECQVAKERIIISPQEQYSRLAGEVEARLTQTRQDMSAAERSSAYPVDQMDVAIKGQAIKFGSRQLLVVDGTYSGKVLDIVAGVVTQKTGRGMESVQHSLSRLSGKVEIGDVVDIQYKNGVGEVSGRAACMSKER